MYNDIESVSRICQGKLVSMITIIGKASIMSDYNPGFRNPEPGTWGQRPHAGIVLARAYRPKGKEGSRQLAEFIYIVEIFNIIRS